MKTKTFGGLPQYFVRLSLLLLVIGFNACDSSKKSLIVPTQIITGSISAITFNTAKCAGTVDPGSETVTEIGHCWSETNNQPTIVDTKVSQVSDKAKQTFISTLTALTSEKLYYVRAYAIINGKAFYGDLVTFTTTKAPVPPPTIITNLATDIQYNSAKVSFTIQFSGSSSATQHGVCWATTTNPTFNDSKTSLGNANGTINNTSLLGSLTEKTTYYARAYAVVGNETFYGNIVNFTTLGIAPTIATGIPTEVLSGSAKINFTIELSPGTSATQHGLCWSTNNLPTTNDSKTSLGATDKNVNTANSLSGLLAKTIYYARAYALVNGTTYYGNVVNFTTSDAAPIINTGAVSEILVNSAKVAFTIQLAVGTSASQHGICWATNNNPTINDNKTSLGATNANVNTTSLLSGLTIKTTYYARAYAVVNGTTYYGNVVNFSTPTDSPQTADGSAGFLFYNSISGQAVFGEIINNNYKDVKALVSIGTNWTQVVAYQGMLLMTKSAIDRTTLISGALFDGKQIVKTFPINTFSTHTHLTVIADKWLLFYDTNSGVFEFGEIQNLNYRSLFKGNNFSSGWSTILSFGNDLFFYNKTTGAGVWGNFNGSAFTMYSNKNTLSRLLTGITYGKNGSFWWYEGGIVYNYSSSQTGPTLIEAQKPNLALFGEASAGNDKNIIQISNTQMSIFSVENDNKLTFRRNVDISKWTHVITIKFN